MNKNKAASKLTDYDITKRQTLKNVMEHELFAEAMNDVKLGLASAMLRSNDPAERERIYCQSLLLNNLQSTLESYVNDLLFLEQKKREEAA